LLWLNVRSFVEPDGQKTPPAYDLSKVTVPTALYVRVSVCCAAMLSVVPLPACGVAMREPRTTLLTSRMYKLSSTSSPTRLWSIMTPSKGLPTSYVVRHSRRSLLRWQLTVFFFASSAGFHMGEGCQHSGVCGPNEAHRPVRFHSVKRNTHLLHTRHRPACALDKCSCASL